MYKQRWYNGGSKYGNIKQEYNGRRYDSKLEAARAQELDLLKKAGEIVEIIPQYKIELRANGHLICNYYVDFYIEYKDGSIVLEEIKGYETDVFRFKRRLLEALYLPEHPEMEYIVLKQSSVGYYNAMSRKK